MTYGTSFILSKENILKKVGEYELFNYYEPNFKEVGKKFKSSWRKEDVPSAIIRVVNGVFFYKDYGCSSDKSYSIWSYLMNRYTLNYYQCLNIVASDFGLLKINNLPTMEIFGIPEKKEVQFKENTGLKIGIKSKEWTTKSLKYWDNYGISKQTIDHFKRPIPISHYFFNDIPYNCKKDENSFAYREDVNKYKIYLPDRPKGERWWSNTGGIIQGWDSLPETGDFLFITSSWKDIMCLYGLGYTSIAPGSENTFIDLKKIEELKTRFKRILLYYNNDVAGIKASIAHSERYNVDYIVNPVDMEKDPSDVVLMYSKEVLSELLKELIK